MTAHTKTIKDVVMWCLYIYLLVRWNNYQTLPFERLILKGMSIRLPYRCERFCSRRFFLTKSLLSFRLALTIMDYNTNILYKGVST